MIPGVTKVTWRTQGYFKGLGGLQQVAGDFKGFQGAARVLRGSLEILEGHL